MFKKELDKVKIAGLSLTSTTEKRLLKVLISKIDEGHKTFIVTPNPEFLVFARHNPWFKRILNKADVAIPDGIGLIWALRFLAFRPLGTLSKHLGGEAKAGAISRHLRGGVIQGRISGTDLMEKLCQEASKRDWSVYLLGGESGVAKKALAVLKKCYPSLRGWAGAGPRIPPHLGGGAKAKPFHDTSEVKKWVKQINQKKPDLLFVAFGMGKQEKFIWDNWGELNVKLAMGVGGAFDYLSGTVPRAPKWVRQLGLEWLYRLIREPWRWKRQLRLIEFIFLIFQEKFRKS